MLPSAMTTKLKRFAAAGALCVLASGSASAGWLCNWTGSSNRPYYDPSHEPNWGVQETTWRRFPAQSHFGQGSYCATGECLPGMDNSFQNHVGIPMDSHPGASMQGMLIQQAPMQQHQIIRVQPGMQQPQMIQAPLQNGMMQIPNQQDSIFAPPEMVPYNQPMQSVPHGNSMYGGMIDSNSNSHPDLQMPSQGGNNAVPLMAPQPQQQPGNPVPMMNNGNLPIPNSTLNPRPNNGSGSTTPVPLPMPDDQLPLPMPPMTQSNYYRSPFDQAAPGNYITNPAANYPQQQQAMIPAQPISYQPNRSSTQPTQSPFLRNPFSGASRFWSRNK